ncbi:MAG: ATP-binding protein [Chloroflexota bacterium]
MDLPSWNVLLVDDDEDDYILTSRLLSTLRHRRIDLAWASSYEQGRQRLRDARYDAVLVDYDLGAYSGIELTCRLVADYPDLPVILYTGRGSYEVDVEAMQAGVTLYITKTEITSLTLERSIRYAIERKQVEEAQRRSARRDAYRVALVDALRPLSDPQQICQAAVQALGEHLNAGRVSYGEVDSDYIYAWATYSLDTPGLLGRYRLDDYGLEMVDRLRAGQNCVVPDVAAQPLGEDERAAYRALEVQAHLTVPLLKDGRLNGLLSVLSTRPRPWTGEDSLLVEETAGRIWDAVQRARAQAAVQESAERFRIMADGTPLMIWVTDAAGRMEFVNRAYCEFFEVTLEQVQQRGWAPLVHPDDHAGYVDLYGLCLQQHTPFQAEARVLRSDGQWRWMASYGQPRISTGGQFLGIAGSSADITERKRVEEQLQVYSRQLERSNRELEQFAYAASHDLQEPLRKIEAFSERLTAGAAELGLVERDYLKRMQRSAGRMRRMIDDLLTLARVSEQGAPFETVDLNDVLLAVLDDLELLIRDSGARITIDRLPPIWGDPTQIHLLMLNLVGNALKFHHPGRTPAVTVWAQKAAGETLVHIEDQGVGFDMHQVGGLFQPFQRLHERAEFEGNGIGLSICRKIVERHGGRIWASSEPGRGAVFSFCLPAV